jgi:hypothetical protein
VRTFYCAHCGRTQDGDFPLPTDLIVARRRRLLLDRRGKTVATALVLVLATGLAQLSLRTTARADAGRRAREAALQRTLTELEAFVAARHGGPFTRPVPAKLLGDKAFALALRGVDPDDIRVGEPEAAPAEAHEFGATMVGLGIADVGDDPNADLATLLSSGIYGFYSPSRGRLYVRATTLTAFARMVLVHELTHAWQDQHYDLATVHRTATGSDAQRAVQSLVEGDATRVERAWRDSRGEAERAEIAAFEAAPSGDGGEPSRAARAYDSLYSFPYVAGERFVDTLARSGGEKAVDAAFADPPVSTEQVLHPARYLKPDLPSAVMVPRDGVFGTLDADELGEAGLAVVAGRGTLDPAAFRAVAGWDGDEYVTWRDGSRVCTRIAVVMDTPADRDRLYGVLRAQAFDDRRLATTKPAGLVMTTCVVSP